MKKMMCIAVIISAFMLLLPLAVLGKDSEIKKTDIIETKATVENTSENEDVFRVYDKESEKTTEMSAEDYIFGVVAAEMPALYEEEALKAQAVAAYTYACYKRYQNKDKAYDITTDYTVDQSFKTLEEAKKDWGSNAEEYVAKIKSVINSTAGERLCINGAPILAVYHAVSCGQTYSAKDVWGKEISYLQSVSAEGDRLASNYITKVSFTEKELKEAFSTALDIKAGDGEILSNLKAESNGLVNSVKLWGEEVTGGDIRSALDLPSPNFKFSKKDDTYTFTVYGRGHGVGMSQNGANYMAKQGYSYKEILSHFYTDCELTKAN